MSIGLITIQSSWHRNEQVCQGGGVKSVGLQRFERSDVLDSALCKNYLFARIIHLQFSSAAGYHFSHDLILDMRLLRARSEYYATWGNAYVIAFITHNVALTTGVGLAVCIGNKLLLTNQEKRFSV